MHKKVTNIENKHVIHFPFFMNMIPLAKLHKSQIVFCIEIKNEYAGYLQNVELYGKKYTLKDNNMRHSLIQEQKEYMIIQTQLMSESIKSGVCSYCLPFNHPVFLLYFSGIDKTKIKNITLMFDNKIIFNKNNDEHDDTTEIFYDDTTKIFYKDNYNGIESNIIIFGDDFNKNNLYLNSTKNFSTIDKAILKIYTDEINADSEINISVMNYNTLYYASGKAGLTFSR